MQRILYILLNLFAFPGLGTFFSGRRKTGLCQIALSTLGYALSLGGMGIIFYRVFHSGLNPMEITEALNNGSVMPLSALFFHLGIAILGMVFFGLSWIWAALTPQGRKTPPPLPVTR